MQVGTKGWSQSDRTKGWDLGSLVFGCSLVCGGVGEHLLVTRYAEMAWSSLVGQLVSDLGRRVQLSTDRGGLLVAVLEPTGDGTGDDGGPGGPGGGGSVRNFDRVPPTFAGLESVTLETTASGYAARLRWSAGSDNLTIRIKGDPGDSQLLADVETYVVPVALKRAPMVTVIIDPSLCGIVGSVKDDNPVCDKLAES